MNLRVRKCLSTQIGLSFMLSLWIAPAEAQAPPHQDVSQMDQAQSWSNISLIPPPIQNSAIIQAPLAEVWDAWTTNEGLASFLSLSAEVDLRPGGVYRAVFVPDAKTPLQRGSDGRVLAIDSHHMLSVSWMTPMNMPELTGNSTVLTIYFTELPGGRQTRVDLVNSGYGTGYKWHDAYDYNVKGWDRVLSALEFRFEHGPIDFKKYLADFKRGNGFPWWREHRRVSAQQAKPEADRR